jgi:hypothetical protein
MSNEVGDSLRMIELSGRGMAMSAKIVGKSFLLFFKLINTIYLAKWKGKASLNHLRAVKGESLAFFQVWSEKKDNLVKIEKELKKHGIMFAKLPDLCGGDGRTQYAFSPADAEKFQLFLKNYKDDYVRSNGQRSNIKVELVTGKDYERSGYDANGNKTAEYEDLEKSAKKEAVIEKSRKKQLPAVILSDAKYTGKEAQAKFFRANRLLEKQQESDSKTIDFNKEFGRIENKRTYDIGFGKERVAMLSDSSYSQKLIMVTIPQEPLALILRNGEIGAIKGDRQSAVLKDDKMYWVVNKLTLERKQLPGRDIAEMFKKPYLKESLAAAKKMEVSKAVRKAAIPMLELGKKK